MNNFITLLLCTNLLISFSNLGFAQPIPDNINYQKYYSIYQQSKQDSDQKRSKADSALADVQSSDRHLQNIIGDIRQNRNTLDQHQNDLVQFAKDIQILQSQNDSIATRISQNNSQISQNNASIQGLQGAVSQNQGQLSRALGERQHANEAYQQNLQNNNAAIARLKQSEADRDSAYAHVARIEQALAQKQSQILQAQSSFDLLDKERIALEQELPSLELQVGSLRAQAKTLQAQVQQLMPAVSALRTQKLALQQQVGQDRQARDSISSQIAKLEQDIQKLTSQISSLQSSIDSNKKAIAAKQQELASAQTQINSLQGQIQELNGSLASLAKQYSDTQASIAADSALKISKEKELVAAKIELRRLESTIPRVPAPDERPVGAGLKSGAAPERTPTPGGGSDTPEIAALKQKIIQLQNEISTLSGSIATQNILLASLAKNAEAVKSQIASTQSQISRINQTVASGPGQIAALQTAINTSEGQLVTAASQKTEAERQKNNLNPQLQAAESKLAESNSAFQRVAQELAVKESELQQVSAQAQTVQRQFEQSEISLSQKQSRLSKIRSDITTLRTTVADLSREIAQLTPQLQAAKAAVTQREQNYQVHLGQQRATQAALSVSQRQLQDIAVIVSNLEDQRHRYDLALQELGHQNSTLQATNGDLQAEYKSNADSIKYKQEMIAWTNEDMVRLRRSNQELATQQISAESQLAADQSVFSNLDQIASRAEGRTSLDYSEYDTRKKLYDSMLADAVSVGTNFGSQQGKTDGAPKGQAAGLSQGAQDGQIKGKNEGLIFGFEKGKIAGDIKGYDDGHTKGAASEADYNSGNANGLILGKADAETEALRIDFVKGKQDQFIKLTSSLPTQVIQLDQGAPLSATRTNGFGLKSMKSIMTRAASTSDCKQSYIDFNTACVQAYKLAYDSLYASAYQEAYQIAYSPSFESARKSAFEQYKNARYEEGYQLAYSPAFDRGMSVGTNEAFQRGVSDGRTLGYNQNIAEARKNAYAKGVEVTNQYFAAHAVLFLKDSKLVRVGLDGSIGGGAGASDLLKLELNVVNYGAVKSDSAKIKIELLPLTSQVTASQTVTQLVSIPGSSVATVSNVLTAKILESATRGSLEQLKLKFTDEEGNISEKTLSVNILPNLQVKVERVDFNASPKVGKNQNIKVWLNNFGNIQPSEKITLGISTQASADLLRINKAEVQVLKLPVGSTFSIPGLSYTVMSKAALEQGVTMTLYLKHGSRVVGKQELLIKN